MAFFFDKSKRCAMFYSIEIIELWRDLFCSKAYNAGEWI
jgi:hypothetical protein